MLLLHLQWTWRDNNQQWKKRIRWPDKIYQTSCLWLATLAAGRKGLPLRGCVLPIVLIEFTTRLFARGENRTEREENKQLLFIDCNMPTQLRNSFDFSAFWNPLTGQFVRPCWRTVAHTHTVTSDNRTRNQLLVFSPLSLSAKRMEVRIWSESGCTRIAVCMYTHVTYMYVGLCASRDQCGRDYAFAAMDRTTTIESLWSIVRFAESR